MTMTFDDRLALMRFVLDALDAEEGVANAAGHGFGHRPVGKEDLNAGWTNLDFTDNVRPSYDKYFVEQFTPDWVVESVRQRRALVVSLYRVDPGEATEALEAAVKAIASQFSGRRGFDPAWAVEEIAQDSPMTDRLMADIAVIRGDVPVEDMSEQAQHSLRVMARRTQPMVAV